MSKVRLILERQMTKVDTTNLECLSASADSFTYAFHHTESDKVWVSQTKSIDGLIDRIRRANTGTNKLDFLPSQLKNIIKNSTDRNIDLYVKKYDWLFAASIMASLNKTDCVLTQPPRVDLIKQTLWLIEHTPTKHYRLYKTHDGNQTGSIVLTDYLSSICPSNTKLFKMANAKTRAFVHMYNIGYPSRGDFKVTLLHRSPDPKEAIDKMEEYIHKRGYALCLNSFNNNKQIKENRVTC